MRILVTGASGFLGSRIVSQAVNEGHEVIALVRQPSSTAAHDTICFDLQREGMADVLPNRIEAVCHSAAAVSLGNTLHDFERLGRDNLAATQNVARFVLARGVRRVVFTSSLSVYSKPAVKLPVGEDAPIMPDSPYAWSKLAGEWIWAAKEFQSAGLGVAILRCSSIYGAGQRTNSVLPQFINRVWEGKDPVVKGEGRRSQDFVSVHDAADAHIRALMQEPSSIVRVFNIGSGEETSLAVLAESVIRVFDETGRRTVHYEPSHTAVDEDRFYFDVSRARQELAYDPVDLITGLSRYRREVERSTVCGSVC